MAAAFLFGWSVFLMLDLHLLEVFFWAFALNRSGLIVHPYDAVYFCANSYTTLGMAKIDVGEQYRLISPIIGISGLFTFAWTTSALVDVVASNRRLLTRMEDEREQEMRMRLALRKEEWNALKSDALKMDALKNERHAGPAENETTPAGSGFSFIQTFRTWREKRMRLAELRKDVTQMNDLRRQERLKEKEADARAATSPEDQQSKGSR